MEVVIVQAETRKALLLRYVAPPPLNLPWYALNDWLYYRLGEVIDELSPVLCSSIGYTGNVERVSQVEWYSNHALLLKGELKWYAFFSGRCEEQAIRGRDDLPRLRLMLPVSPPRPTDFKRY